MCLCQEESGEARGRCELVSHKARTWHRLPSLLTFRDGCRGHEAEALGISAEWVSVWGEREATLPQYAGG